MQWIEIINSNNSVPNKAKSKQDELAEMKDLYV